MAAVVRGCHIGETAFTSQAGVAWFWAGMCLMVLPLAVLMARASTPPALRTALLAFYGVASYAPKLLLDPHSPLYPAEFASWRATDDVLHTGRLFRPAPLAPSRYPGLHAATAALVHATGLTIWQAATLLLVVCHVTLVLGIAALAESIGLARLAGESPSRAPLGTRIACLAAICYGLNSSFLYADTQYAGESMAITLVVWTLVAYARAIRAGRRPGRAAWSMLAVTLAAATVVTHQLSAVTLVLIMTLAGLAATVPSLARAQGWRRAAVLAWSLTLITAGMTGAWSALIAPAAFARLSPHPGRGPSQVMRAASGPAAGRAPFQASLSPWWEQGPACLVTILALALAAGGLLLLRSRMGDQRLPKGRRRALTAAFATLGLICFPSAVLSFSPAVAEGASRSQAFTWIGLCLLMSLAAVWLLDWARLRPLSWSRHGLRTGLAAALAVGMVGGTAPGLAASYRFPGPGTDGAGRLSLPALTSGHQASPPAPRGRLLVTP
jgi:hypothetical protein